MGKSIHNLLREPQPAIVLDLGQGSREQSLPVSGPAAARMIADKQAEIADKS